MPRACFAAALEFLFARMVASGMVSIRPPPKRGVGIRKIRLLFAAAALKSGWEMLQPGASGRPVIVKRSCTPPSRVPLELNLKRASRTGPSLVMKNGTWLGAVATVDLGFVNGLVPPTAGWA